MSPRHPLALIAAQAAYQLRLYRRSPRATISALATPLILLALLSAISDHAGTVGYHGSLAMSMVVLGVSSTCYTSLAASLVASRDAGVVKRLRATPLPLWAHLAGRVLGTVAVAAGQAVVIVAVAVVAYHARLRPAGLVPAAAGLLLGCLVLGLLGVAVAQLIPRGDAAATLLSTTMLPVVLVSGVFFPIGELPGWLSHVAAASPLTHLGALLTPAVADGAGAFSDVAWLLGWAAVAAAVALRRFRTEPA